MINKIKLGKFILALMLVANIKAQAQDWELSTQKKGVTVYTREEVGSTVKAFKAETDIQASASELLEVISNFKTYSEWYDHCKSAQLISQEGDDQAIYHIEYSMPFPFSNRDVVNESTTKEDGELIRIEFEQKEGVLKESKHVVRMPISKGYWELRPNRDGSTHVIHQYLGDPAGNVPTGIVNMFLVAGPVNTLTQLSDYIKER